MAILDSIGTAPSNGASSQGGTLTNYIVESSSSGSGEVDFEDVFNADGAIVSRLIFNRDPIINLVLIAKNAAAPSTDFPAGDICAVTGLTSYYVESCDIATSKGATRVTVTLKNIGIVQPV